MIFFFNDTPTTEIYTLSLHDALPISWPRVRHERSRAHPGERLPGRPLRALRARGADPRAPRRGRRGAASLSPLRRRDRRSEEHTSELQSQSNLVCRLLLEKKNKNFNT